MLFTNGLECSMMESLSRGCHVRHTLLMTSHASHVAHDGALSAGGGGRPARPEHLGVEPVADQDQHQRRLGLQGLQLLICNMSGVSGDTRLE